MRFPSSNRLLVCAVVGLLVAGALFAQVGSRVPNWTVPPYRAQSGSGGLSPMIDISDAAIFVAVTPCRVVDTRTQPPSAYGAPSLATNAPRAFDIDNGPCTGIPAGSAAYSLSIGAILPPADGFLKAWPTGAAEPLVSQLNFLAGEVVANAAIVPSNSAGSINVLVNIGPTDVYIDINGYFMDSGGQLNDNTTLRVTGTDANEPTIYGLNLDTTSASEFMNGVRGYINTVENNAAGAQIGPSGVYGWSDQITGVNYGVLGRTDSTTNGAAGVRGQAASIPAGPLLSHLNAGVLGVSDDNVGVLGITQGAASDGAVRGRFYDATGTTLQSEGILGFDSNTGVRFINGLDGTGTKAFIEPHPTDPTKMIKYVSLEGNEVGTYFRGKGRFERGVATIEVPEDFRMVTHEDGLSIQVTPIGEMATVAVARIGLDRIVVRGSRNVEFFYTVNGVRKAYPTWNPIWDNNGFIPASAESKIPDNLTSDEKRRLISNGTYLPDGSVNRETARRLGWERKWSKQLSDDDVWPPKPTPQPDPNP